MRGLNGTENGLLLEPLEDTGQFFERVRSPVVFSVYHPLYRLDFGGAIVRQNFKFLVLQNVCKDKYFIDLGRSVIVGMPVDGVQLGRISDLSPLLLS